MESSSLPVAALAAAARALEAGAAEVTRVVGADAIEIATAELLAAAGVLAAALEPGAALDWEPLVERAALLAPAIKAGPGIS